MELIVNYFLCHCAFCLSWKTSAKTNKKINSEKRGLVSNFCLLLRTGWEQINSRGVVEENNNRKPFLSLHSAEPKPEVTHPPANLLRIQASVTRTTAITVWSLLKKKKMQRAYWNASIFIFFWWLSQRITMFSLDIFFSVVPFQKEHCLF